MDKNGVFSARTRMHSDLDQLLCTIPRSQSRDLVIARCLYWDGFDASAVISNADGTRPGGGGVGLPITGGSGGASSGAAAPDASKASGGAASVGNLLPWLYPTADFLNLDKAGAVALPAIGSSATILSFKLPNGRNGKITQLGIDFVTNGGAVFNQGVIPFQLAFQIATDAKGYSFQDYESFFFSPGAVSAPTPINGLMIKEGQTIFVKVTNNSIVVTTQFLAARLLGYTYSKNLEPNMLSYQ
jgi:hypothetical protein